MPSLRIAVLSDLHMHQSKPVGSAPSYLSAQPVFNVSRNNPIFDAAELLCALKKSVDWIICPGDISDQNDAVSASVAWQQLGAMKRKVRARRLIGNVGNHDMDSRRKHGDDKPEQSLKALAPRFPLSDQRLANKFWANDYVVLKEAGLDVTLVLVNSCALHGIEGSTSGRRSQVRSYEHGLINNGVIGQLASELPGKLSSINILVMHHHIRQHPWMPDDNSHAVNGPRLLEVLRETGRRWLVIHGHQHWPNLSYGSAEKNSPVVLSAGSIAAKRYDVRGRTPRNQMHFIEFADTSCAKATISTWNWAQALGWSESYPDSGLPWQCGFGCEAGLQDICAAINQHLDLQATKRADWSQLLSVVPDLPFLVPDELVLLVQLLAQSGTEVLYDKLLLPRLLDRGRAAA